MGPLQSSTAVRSQAMLPASLWQASALKRLARPAHVALLHAAGFYHSAPIIQTEASNAASESFGSAKGAFLAGGLSPLHLVTVKKRAAVTAGGAKVTAGADLAEKKGGAFQWDPEELRKIQEEKEKWLKSRAGRWDSAEEPQKQSAGKTGKEVAATNEDAGVAWPKALKSQRQTFRPPPVLSEDEEDEWTDRTWGKAITNDRSSQGAGPSRRQSAEEDSDSVRQAPWERARPKEGKESFSNPRQAQGRSEGSFVNTRQAQGRSESSFVNPRQSQSRLEGNPRRNLAEAGLAANPRKKPSYERESAGDGEPAKELPSSANQKVLLGRSLEQLTAFAVEQGEKKFRGQQLYDALYKQKAQDWSQITGLPKAWREKLESEGIQVGRAPVHTAVQAKDGTAKLLLRLHDGRLVETVGIPGDSHGKEEPPADGSKRQQKGHLTACISSQVGCALKCAFCATGKGGFSRHLEAYEIVDQVLAIEQFFGERVSNIVFMGMGEPMLNLKNVLPAFRSINKDVGIGQRSITISTVGVPNSIAMLADYKLQATLAVSLHAPNQRLREQIIPSARSYPLNALLTDCREYFAKTGRRVSFEYTLLAGVNDSYQDARELADLLYQWKLAHHVNVIPYNPVEDSEFKRPDRAAVQTFVDTLLKHKLTASIRRTRGLEANAACGQLRNAFQKTPLSDENQENLVEVAA